VGGDHDGRVAGVVARVALRAARRRAGPLLHAGPPRCSDARTPRGAADRLGRRGVHPVCIVTAAATRALSVVGLLLWTTCWRRANWFPEVTLPEASGELRLVVAVLGLTAGACEAATPSHAGVSVGAVGAWSMGPLGAAGACGCVDVTFGGVARAERRGVVRMAVALRGRARAGCGSSDRRRGVQVAFDSEGLFRRSVHWVPSGHRTPAAAVVPRCASWRCTQRGLRAEVA
jgi:hypothetical protein